MSDYIDNKKFYQELLKHSIKKKEAIAEGKPIPPPNNYIGMCILEICRRYSYKHNFINYSFREEMVSDAVVNCLKYFDKFDFDIISIKPLNNIEEFKITPADILVGVDSGSTVKVKAYKKKTNRILGHLLTETKLNTRENVSVTRLGETTIIEIEKITYQNPLAYITMTAHNEFLHRIKSEKKQQILKSAMIAEMPMEFFEIQMHDEDEDYIDSSSIQYIQETLNEYYKSYQSVEKTKKPKKVKNFLEAEIDK